MILFEKTISLLQTREGESNAMSFSGKNNKQQAAQHTNSDRKHDQELPRFIGRCGIETLDNILVKESNSYKNQERSEGMEEINKAKPVFSSLFFGKRSGAIDDPEASKCGDPISDFATFVPETVSEEEEETGQGTQQNEGEGGGLADVGVAVALVCEDWGQNLEAEDGACGEEVG